MAKHPWAYIPGPKPLKARTRKPYLVLGLRPRTQNYTCVDFAAVGQGGAEFETFRWPGEANRTRGWRNGR